jgi:hypothetical protein
VGGGGLDGAGGGDGFVGCGGAEGGDRVGVSAAAFAGVYGVCGGLGPIRSCRSGLSWGLFGFLAAFEEGGDGPEQIGDRVQVLTILGM